MERNNPCELNNIKKKKKKTTKKQTKIIVDEYTFKNAAVQEWNYHSKQFCFLINLFQGV